MAVMDLPEQAEVVVSTLDELAGLGAWRLSRLVDGIEQPADGDDAAGFLTDIRDRWVECARGHGAEGRRRALDDVAGEESGSYVEALATQDQWGIFAELCAWNVEPFDDSVPWDASDFRNLACRVLSKVAYDLWIQLTAGLDEDEDEDEDDGPCPCGKSHTRGEHGYAGE